jgi:hypothetical protein
MAQMDDLTLASIVKNRVSDAIGLSGDQLSQDRMDAMKYYRGEKFGNERDGRSQVVSRDVAEAVDGILPGLIKIFMSGDEIVRYEPRGPEDEANCKQATDYVNWILNQQNDGFRLFYTWFKDALLQRTGIVKIWWDDAEKITKEVYKGLSEEQFAMLQMDESIEITEVGVSQTAMMGTTAMTPMGPQPPTYDVTVSRTNMDGQVRIEPVPPEEFLIERWSVDLDSALFCAHRFRRTVSELVAKGYDREQIERAVGADNSDFSGERASRHWDEGQIDSDQTLEDETIRYVWVAECYMKVDYDGDGFAELRKITACGDSQYEILDNEEIDEYPFATLSPILMPHKFHGMSVADQVMDLQLLKSTLWRQMLDNLYLANEPQRVVVNGKVNLDDMLSGGNRIIRTTDIGAVREVSVPFVAKETFPMLEYIDHVREQRTGISDYSQGLDANSLNKTATGIGLIQNAAAQRQELIARVFAETGVKRLFKLILGLVSKYQKKPQIVRLRNQWVPMDPREWKNSYDVSINVGLGTGNKQEQIAALTNLLGIDEKIIAMQGGVDGPIVTGKNLYNKLVKLIEATGLKSPEAYYTDPATVQPNPPKPSPEEQKAQAEIQLQVQKHKLDAQAKQNDAQIQAGIDSQKASREVQVMWAKANAQIEIEKAKAQAQLEIEKMKANVQAQLASQKMEMDARRQNFKAATDAARADTVAENSAQVE